MRQLSLAVSCRVHSTCRWVKVVAMATSGKAGCLAGTSSFSIVFPLSLSCSSLKHPVYLVACQCSKEEREERFLYTWQPSEVLSSPPAFLLPPVSSRGFPGGSSGKESACHARGVASMPESGGPPGEGSGRPLQCPWASLAAPLVKSPPATRET